MNNENNGNDADCMLNNNRNEIMNEENTMQNENIVLIKEEQTEK